MKRAMNSQKKPENRRKKRRTQLARKIDLMRNEFRLELKRIRQELRILTHTLAPIYAMDEAYITKIVCDDEGDEALLEALISAGQKGITPSEISQNPQFAKFQFQPYHVTRRLQRMNKRLDHELGKKVAEVYHRRWMITRFVQASWNATKEEIEDDSR